MHIYHALFTAFRGGLEQAFVNDTEALRSKGHHVTALIRPDAPYRDELAPLASELSFVTPKGFYDVFAIAKVRMMLRKTRPDCIIAHNGRAITLMSYAAWGLGIPVCGVTHSYKATHVMRADRLVVLTQHMYDHFIKSGYNKPMTIIPNLMHLPPQPEFKPHRKTVVIGCIGRFSPEKGFDDFFHALHELKAMGLDFVAHVGGGGDELDNLKALKHSLGLQDHIKWCGWVKDKAAFYKELDIFCLPSRQDSLPMVMIESLAYGIPFVSTDTPGPATVIIEGVNGMVVPRENPSAMAKALYQVATNPQLAQKLASGALEKAKDFSFDAVANQWDALLNNIISANKVRPAA
jgi:glycosyltransferase involved in cell wall biosynthesis